MEATALDYCDEGIRRLLHAIEHGPPADHERPSEAEMVAALDRAGMAEAAWQGVLEQMGQARSWDRGSLGVPAAGDPEPDELTPRQAGQRAFLRNLAAVIVGERASLSAQAAEVHALVFGNGPSRLTWRDIRYVCEGRKDQPDTLVLAGIVEMVRAGVTQRDIAERTGVSTNQIGLVSDFMRVREFREEAKARMVKLALERGWSGAELARQFRAAHPGLSMGEDYGRELLRRERNRVAA